MRRALSSLLLGTAVTTSTAEVVRYYFAYETSDCTGPVAHRSWISKGANAVPLGGKAIQAAVELGHTPQAPHGECWDIGGGVGLKNMYADMSTTPPTWNGVETSNADCTGTEYPYAWVADGETCNPAARPNDDVQSYKVLLMDISSSATMSESHWSDHDCQGTTQHVCLWPEAQVWPCPTAFRAAPHSVCRFNCGSGSCRGLRCEGNQLKHVYFPNSKCAHRPSNTRPSPRSASPPRSCVRSLVRQELHGRVDP